MKHTQLSILLISTLCCSNMAMADVNVTNVELGYKAYTSSTKTDNKGVFDQSFVKLNHLAIVDWGNYFANIKLENPGQWSHDQSGQAGKTTLKALNIIEYNLGTTKFNLWGQNFISANKTVVEDNLYLGVSHDVSLAGVSINYGLGANYTFASLTPTNGEFNGMSGYATVLNLRYPLTVLGLKNMLSLNYEGQFDRATEHQHLLGYRSYGHQIITTLKTNISKSIYSKLHITHFDSWGSTPRGGIEYGVAIGMNF
ncbi:outer membrane protein OmpK [Shewanella marina]|uniref:outer membrane protein OmpK n=1 Tax=Shewanella marina TaxID=487319 RepID=UPI000472188D|nr:outer membrane protein OmpK [Shewanella marina]